MRCAASPSTCGSPRPWTCRIRSSRRCCDSTCSKRTRSEPALVVVQAARLAHVVALHLDQLRLTRKLDALLLQDRHEPLGEFLHVLARLPDLADLEVAAGSEADVRE